MFSPVVAAKCVYTILAFLFAVGIICNSTLLFITIRTRSLRSPCNILIGSCALFDVLHQLGCYTMSTQIYREKMISSWSCSLIMFIPEMGIAAGSFTVLSIGIDRFVSTAAPNWYRSVNLNGYLAVQYLAILGYCGYNAFLMMFFYREHNVICSPPSVYHDAALQLWAGSSALVNVIAIAIYAATWRLIKAQAHTLEAKQQARIFRTIVLVTIFDLSGWAITQTLVAAQASMDLSDAARLCYVCFAAFFVHFGLSVKFIVYYCTSTEYRQAVFLLRKPFLLRKVSQVSSSLSHPQSTARR